MDVQSAIIQNVPAEIADLEREVGELTTKLRTAMSKLVYYRTLVSVPGLDNGKGGAGG